jgi:equilibrative nucleoside transporter 1/2/3
MCTFPLLVSFYPADSITGQNLPSLLSTVYCLGQLIFLGIAQRQVGQVRHRRSDTSNSKLTIQKSPTAQIRWSLLLLIATFILTTFPLLPLLLPSLSTNLILPILLVIVFFLNLSTSYFQSAALALASLWGSSEILAALSGQGGVAVLISLFQLVLAVIGAFGTGAGTGGGEGEDVPSMLAGVGLWGMGSIGAGLCWLAFRFLSTHPAYERVVRSATEGRGGAEGDGKKGNWNRTVKVLKKNKLLYLAVALDFAVTLVRCVL